MLKLDIIFFLISKVFSAFIQEGFFSFIFDFLKVKHDMNTEVIFVFVLAIVSIDFYYVFKFIFTSIH
jgi:hypothetical protein